LVKFNQSIILRIYESILKIDTIIQAKQTIFKYEKYFDSLSAIENIEIKDEIEKLKKILMTQYKRLL